VPISKPSHYVKPIEILTEPERRRRRTAQEKIAIVQETLAPGASVSAVARRHGVNPNQVFGWRKQYQEGSLAAVQAGETVVPASELAAAIKEIKELQRLLGKNGMDASAAPIMVRHHLSRESVNGTDHRWRRHCEVNRPGFELTPRSWTVAISSIRRCFSAGIPPG